MICLLKQSNGIIQKPVEFNKCCQGVNFVRHRCSESTFQIYQRERPRNQSFPAASPTSTRRAGSTVSKSSKKHPWSSRSKKTKPTNYSRPRKSVDSSRRSQNSSSLRSSGTSKSWNPCRPLWSPHSRKSKSGSRSARGSTRTARSGRSKKSARSQSSRSKRRNIRQRKSESGLPCLIS